MKLFAGARASLLISLCLLAGCAGEKKQRPVKKRTPTVNTTKAFTGTIDNVQVMVDAYSSAQCQDYFGVDLVAHNIQPIVIEVHNHTPNEIEFRSSYIDLDILSADDVAQALHYNTWAWSSATLGLGWLGLQLFAPFAQLIFYTPWIAYTLHQQNNRISESVESIAYDGREAVLVFEPYTRNHFMVCVDHDRFKRNFGLRFFVPDEKRLITMMVHLKNH